MLAMTAGSNSASVPLCVDLDGTLTKGDLTIESAFLLLKRRPLHFLRLLPLLFNGKAPFKRAVARAVDVSVDLLPWNRGFLEYLNEEHRRGRPLLLVSASDELLVRLVGDYHGIFCESIGSNGVENLRSANKRDYLIGRFGDQGYDYAGNDAPDFKVWEAARNAVVVNPSCGVEKTARAKYRVSHVFPRERPPAQSILRALRVHQWLKNMLVFAPLILAHRFLEPALWFQSIIAFFAFSFCASAIYVVNDAFDLESDRAHARKRNRPLPAGDLQLNHALLLIAVLLIGAAALALGVGLGFAACLALYFFVCVAYSFFLKRVALLDIFVLASLYVLRVLSG